VLATVCSPAGKRIEQWKKGFDMGQKEVPEVGAGWLQLLLQGRLAF
jgi:hypothetical protein